MTIINMIDSSLALRSTADRLRAYLHAHPEERDAILRLARTAPADRTDADNARIADLAERLADEAPTNHGDTAQRLVDVEARIERYRTAFPTESDEVARLSALALSENPTASNLSTDDAAEVERLVQVAASLNGTATNPDVPEAPEAPASDDAEINRLRALAKELS